VYRVLYENVDAKREFEKLTGLLD